MHTFIVSAIHIIQVDCVGVENVTKHKNTNEGATRQQSKPKLEKKRY